jgi:hypothetical protein
MVITIKKINHTFHTWNVVYTNLYNVVDSNGFDVSTQCITYDGQFLAPKLC